MIIIWKKLFIFKHLIGNEAVDFLVEKAIEANNYSAFLCLRSFN